MNSFNFEKLICHADDNDENLLGCSEEIMIIDS